jgi:membrane fusion protein (multidrug efflux system)
MKLPLKKIVILLIIVILLVLAGRKGMDWYEHGRYIEETDNAYIKADSVAIRPEISGRIATVAVAENQHVSKGQLLIQIEASDYQSKVLQAKAQLAVGQASLADAQAQLLLQYKTLDEASANIDAANAELHRAELELKRFQVLEKQSFDSKQQVQNAEAAVAVARAKVAQATAAKAAANQMLQVLSAKIDIAKAQISVAESEVVYVTNQLEKTAILAPNDGIIGNLAARAGSAAQPAMTLLYLVPLPNIYVVANYKETQIGHMTRGQAVSLKVDSQPEVEFTGVLESISPATGTEFSLLPNDNATGNFNKIVQRVPVRIRVTGPLEALATLRPGMSVVPKIDTQGFEQQVSYLPNDEEANAGLASQLAQ